jgi:benzoyl-CoA reductase/2-hydroxyglutaryl-CoA dehydratase subunit BcrC/BadD/HgdB
MDDSLSPHEILERLRAQYRDPHRAARAWKAGGGTVVGYLCDNVPVEMIDAAGFLPVRVTGDPEGSLDAVRRYVDGLFQPTRRIGFAESMLARLLDGTYAYLDYLIVPHNRHAIQAIYQELLRAGATYPELRLPRLHLLDKSWLPFYASEAFNRDRLLDLGRALETWAGRPLTNGTLAEAIAARNEQRSLLAQVAALRAADLPRLSGLDALHVIGSSMTTPVREHTASLRALLAGADQLPLRAGLRVFVGGSPHDNPARYDVVEACGATVVAEDHCWGSRAADFPVRTDLEPLSALASRFHQQPACSIRFPLRATVDACVRRAALARADAAIFFDLEHETAQVWETPDEVRALGEHGIPSLHLSEQPYHLADPAALRQQIEAFLAPLRRGRRHAVSDGDGDAR